MATEPNDLEIAYEFFVGVSDSVRAFVVGFAKVIGFLVLPVSMAAAGYLWLMVQPETQTMPEGDRIIATTLVVILGIVAGLSIELRALSWFEDRWREAKRRARRKKNG